jgi:hypothetical protein
MSEQYYVYAVAAVDTPLPAGVSGFGGPLHLLACGQLGAVVSVLRAADAGDAGDARPAATTDNLVRHEQVVEAVCAAGAALPVRFGTVLPTAEAVTRALAAQEDTLRADLGRIGDKIEEGVAVLWPSAGATSTMAQPSAEVGGRAGDDAAPGRGGRRGVAYLRGRQAEYRRAEANQARAEALARDLDAALRPHALDCRRSLCPSERLALRDRYLLERTQASAFQATFDEVRQRHPEVRFLLSGPWPPYSFVTPPALPDTSVPAGPRASGSGSNGLTDAAH